LDVNYNDDETELIIQLNEKYNQPTTKIDSFEGINTDLNVTFNDITQSITLVDGKGVMNIKNATRSESEKVTVDYCSNKFNFELKRKTGTFTEMKNLIEAENNTVILDKNYQYDQTSDKDLINGIIINKEITIDGNGHNINGLNKSRIFNIQSDNVTIKNIELENGNHDELAGAIYWNASNGKLLNSTLTNNFAPNGGAIYLAKDNNTINSSKFYENEAGLYGGAIYVGQKDTVITNNLFENNHATAGDNYAVYIAKEEYVKEFENNTFINNTKTDYGGDASDDEDYTGNRINKKTVSQSNSQYQNKQEKTIYTKITVNNRDIPIINNHLTLDTLMKIFNQDFTNGHLLVYIDGKLVFNGTTTDDITQVIYDLINLLSGKHEIKVEFMDSEGKTNTYTENITI
jgi:predicted outer membrane repeat protein